jgi:prevent-host-death family protein
MDHLLVQKERAMHISLTDAKAKLTDLVRRAEAGDEVILTRHGQPAVRLVPMARKLSPDELRAHRRAAIDRAIAAARERGLDDDCPLLFVGQDFALTDVKAAFA